LGGQGQVAPGISAIPLARIVGHESLTMMNEVYQHLTVGAAHDALMRVLRAK
jgi:hypothetical protein